MSDEPGYDEPCPNDPVGEGLHYFDDSDRCKYCGALDPLRADSYPSVTDD